METPRKDHLDDDLGEKIREEIDLAMNKEYRVRRTVDIIILLLFLLFILYSAL
jgi:hypothetical protein